MLVFFDFDSFEKLPLLFTIFQWNKHINTNCWWFLCFVYSPLFFFCSSSSKIISFCVKYKVQYNNRHSGAGLGWHGRLQQRGAGQGGRWTGGGEGRRAGGEAKRGQARNWDGRPARGAEQSRGLRRAGSDGVDASRSGRNLGNIAVVLPHLLGFEICSFLKYHKSTVLKEYPSSL